MTRTVEADYLVVGAGAMGMAFTDALIDHADVRVALVDRRHSVSGHWIEAYPFVRLHQASAFYGVASHLLGGGQLQQRGPEEGLQERASQPQICAYYTRMLERMLESGRVEFFPNSEYVGDRAVVSRISGERAEVPGRCRIVDARYLAPSIPAERPPPFGVTEDARVLPVGDLARLEEAPSQYVVVGSGKTATDACIWLLSRGVDPDAICWVRPRDPWMMNRAVVQPDPAIFLRMAADTMQAAQDATSLEELFLRLEEAGIMLRIDRTVMPTMAKTPTLATWELEQLRTLENVVRRGHIQAVDRGKLTFADGPVAVAQDAVVVHCAADGLKYPPLVPVWRPEAITLQPIRAGFPCFGAALSGYVEATRDDDDEKNRLCPPSPYGNSMAQWARMNVLGTRAAMSFSSEPDVKEWSNQVALNPARIPPGHPGSAALDDALERLAAHTRPGLARLAELM
ncbi:MAG TPA: pyridine nucleotide-disulfide oxidoreductase [Intrasporangium sp.]|uniref:pyridine nucleotide-disulfide oxidoreductase n=1 Tax=Intrasporangium sp. TaxID=1925024 RepID=UPI002D78C6D7|nr:pyridine nucleotide-disulfide oxidoreductase [Intrasporangium sp.]HET7399428.1 pyridine nucleotide-disulfide oxidoreductase [Intrasporangium sp.]